MKEKHTNSRNLLFRHTIDVRFNWTKSCFYAPGSEDYIELRKETDCVCSMSLTIMQCTIYSTPPIFPPTAFWQQINFNSPAFHCVCAYLWRQSKKVQSGRKTFPYIWRTVNNKKKSYDSSLSSPRDTWKYCFVFSALYFGDRFSF